MTVGPRIVFTRFVTHSSPKLALWRDHTRRVVGESLMESLPSADGSEDCAMVWNLVSANNRMLARSATVFDSFDRAVASAARAVDADPTLSVTLVSDDRHGVLGWYAAAHGAAVMTCSRWYATERDRRHAIELALASIAVALLSPGSRLMDPSLLGGARDLVES